MLRDKHFTMYAEVEGELTLLSIRCYNEYGFISNTRVPVRYQIRYNGLPYFNLVFDGLQVVPDRRSVDIDRIAREILEFLTAWYE